MGIRTESWQPSAALVGAVEGFWYIEDPLSTGLERRLPSGSMQLIFNLDADRLSWLDGLDGLDGPAPGARHTVAGAAITGASASVVGIDRAEQRRTVGVCLRPAAAGACAGVPADALDAPLIDLRELWGPAAVALHERLVAAVGPREMGTLLEEALCSRLAEARLDAAVAHAADRLWRGAPVGEVAAGQQSSRSTFLRRFRADVGLAPKRYQRIGRLQRVLRRVATSVADGSTSGVRGGRVPVDWSTVAVEAGFSDQAHLVHDFVELTGLTPTQYRPRPGAGPNHAL